MKICSIGFHMTSFRRHDSIYNETTMKLKHILGIAALLLVVLIAILALTNFHAPAAFAQNTLPGTAYIQQPTSTPAVNDGSEIGSTTGILIMGVVIVLIITLPLIFYKRK